MTKKKLLVYGMGAALLFYIGLVLFLIKADIMRDPCRYKFANSQPKERKRDPTDYVLSGQYAWDPLFNFLVARSPVPLPVEEINAWWENLKRAGVEGDEDYENYEVQAGMQVLHRKDFLHGLEYFNSYYERGHLSHNFKKTFRIGGIDYALVIYYSPDKAPGKRISASFISNDYGTEEALFFERSYSEYLTKALRKAPHPVAPGQQRAYTTTFTCGGTVFEGPALMASGEYAWTCGWDKFVRRSPLPLPVEEIQNDEGLFRVLENEDAHYNSVIGKRRDWDWRADFSYFTSTDDENGLRHSFARFADNTGEIDSWIHYRPDGARYGLPILELEIDDQMDDSKDATYKRCLNAALSSCPHPE